MKYLITIISVVFLGCQKSSPDLRNIAEEENVKEAVFRYQLVKANVNRIYYLSITTLDPESKSVIYNDPSIEFMHRFEVLPQRVKCVSQCYHSEIVKDKVTGESGIILRISTIKWVSPTEAIVDGGYYTGPVGAAGNSYRVQFQQKRWIVTSYKNNWIS